MIISQGKPTIDQYTDKRGNLRNSSTESSDIWLRWREQNNSGVWERREKKVTNFKPYCYVDLET